MIPRLGPRAGLREFAAAFLPAAPGEVAAFEGEFAAAMGSARAVAFPYARTALLLLLEALGVTGQEVLVPAYTCVVVAHAVVAGGNEPVFVDCAPDSFNMDLEAALRAVTPKTAAILPTSLYGHPVDLEALDAFRAEHPGLRVIQDCALGYDPAWRGRPVQRAGDAAIVSFNAGKVLFSIFGGMAVTDDPALADRLAELRGRRLTAPGLGKSLRRRAYLAASLPALTPALYGAVHALSHSGLLDRFVKYFDEGVIDMPPDHLEGMAPVEARVGRIQLASYAENRAERRAMAQLFARELADVPGLVLPPAEPGESGAAWSHYTVRVPEERRPGLLAFAAGRGVELGTLFPYAVPELPAYRGRPGWRGPYPRAKRLARTVVNLPLCAGLAGAARVAGVVRDFFRQGSGGGGR